MWYSTASFEDTVATLAASRSTNEPETIVVTGANSGVGLMTCRLFLSLNPQNTLIVVARSVQKAETAIKEICSSAGLEEKGTMIPMACDQSSFESVEDFSLKLREFLTKESKTIDALCLNAGFLSGEKEPSFTKDNLEMQFQVNYASIYLLVARIHDLMDPEKGRIVITASSSHEEGATFGDFKGMIDSETGKVKKQNFANMSGKDFTPFSAYEESKLATVSWCMELNRRLKKISGSKVIANCCCIGFNTQSSMYRNQNYYIWYAIHFVASYIVRTSESLEWSGANVAWLAVSDDVGKRGGGEYYRNQRGASRRGGHLGVDYKPNPTSEEAANEELQGKLWKYTAELLGIDEDFLSK